MIEPEYISAALATLSRDPKIREDIRSLHKKYVENKGYRHTSDFALKMQSICRRAYVYKGNPYLALLLSAFGKDEVVRKSFLVKGYFMVTKRNLEYRLCDEFCEYLKMVPLGLERVPPRKNQVSSEAASHVTNASGSSEALQKVSQQWVENFKKDSPLNFTMLQVADRLITQFGTQNWKQTFGRHGISLNNLFVVFLGRPHHFVALAESADLKNVAVLYEIITGNNLEVEIKSLEDIVQRISTPPEEAAEWAPIQTRLTFEDLDCEVVRETPEYVDIRIRIHRKD